MTTLDQIQLIAEKSSKQEQKKIAQLLHSAMNDWPGFDLKGPENINLETYIAGIQEWLGDKTLTKQNIENSLKLLNHAHNAWEIESVSAFLEIFDLLHSSEIDIATLENLLK